MRLIAQAGRRWLNERAAMKNKHFAVLVIALLGANYAVQKESEGNTRDALKEAITFAVDQQEKASAESAWLDYHNTRKQRIAAVTGCQRTNVPRQQLYGFLVDARQRNIDSLPSQHGAEASATRMAIEHYSARARRLVRAVKPFQLSPGSPQVNCHKAFPPPDRPDVPKPEPAAKSG